MGQSQEHGNLGCFAALFLLVFVHEITQKEVSKPSVAGVGITHGKRLECQSAFIYKKNYINQKLAI